jgi:mannose-6-phosphate isomerase-like protein (cupin superfamily)
MAPYTKLNLKRDVKDMAPDFGMSPGLESRFARTNLELENSGLSYYRVAPGYRLPFGHRHGEQEELYLIVSGSARIKVGDEIVELAEWDVLRVPPGTERGFEGGADGAEIIAFGAPNTDNKDIEMLRDWWTD